MLNHFWDICPCQPSSCCIFHLISHQIPTGSCQQFMASPHVSPIRTTQISSQQIPVPFLPHFVFHETTMKIERHRCPTAPVLKRPTTKVTSGRGVSWRRKLLAAFFHGGLSSNRGLFTTKKWEFIIEKYGFQALNTWSSLSHHQTWES